MSLEELLIGIVSHAEVERNQGREVHDTVRTIVKPDEFVAELAPSEATLNEDEMGRGLHHQEVLGCIHISHNLPVQRLD